MFKILICEESLSYSAKSLFLEYEYDIARDKEHFLNLTYEKSYDLYIIHMECFLMLKELQGCEDETAVIFIDEYYSIQNLKKALGVGDTYMVKPLYLEELAIRVAYFYRKTYKCQNNILRYKEFFYHTNTKQLYIQTEKIKLSPNKLKLVQLFFTHVNQPVHKDIIYETLESSSDGSLRVYISELGKLGLDLSYERANLSYTLKS